MSFENLLDESVLEDYVKYATDNSGDIDPRVSKHVEFVMSNFASGEIKEKIVTEVLGYDQNIETIHGCDAYNNGRPVEIKSETVSYQNRGGTQEVRPLAGNAAWTSTNYEEKVIKLVEEDQEFVLAGFSSKGKIAYILSCNLNDTEIPDCILESIERNGTNKNKKSANITPKSSHTHLSKFEVKYLHKDLAVQCLLSDRMTIAGNFSDEFAMRGPFLDKIKDNLCEKHSFLSIPLVGAASLISGSNQPKKVRKPSPLKGRARASRITPALVSEMTTLREEGLAMRTIAEKLNISTSSVHMHLPKCA